MKKFRICKNKYEWFKLQLWHPPRKILFMNLKGKWKDTCFTLRSRKCTLFKTFSEAKKAKVQMMLILDRFVLRGLRKHSLILTHNQLIQPTSKLRWLADSNVMPGC